IAKQRVPLAQLRDKPGMVLEAGAVDDAAAGLQRRGVDERAQAAAPELRRRHDTTRAPAQVEIAEQIERNHSLTVAHCQVGEHARAQGNHEEWLTRYDGVRAYARPAPRTGSPARDRPSSRRSGRYAARAAPRR